VGGVWIGSGSVTGCICEAVSSAMVGVMSELSTNRE